MLFGFILCVLAIQCRHSYASNFSLSAAYLINQTEFDEEKYPIGTDPTSFLIHADDPTLPDKISNISEKAIPVIIGAEYEQIPFDLESYFAELKTETLGRNLIIGDRIPTTMNIAHDFGGIPGLLVIANEQTKGRGGNNTSWNSPRGDHMITVNIKLKKKAKSTLLGAHGALSMMKAITSTSNGSYSDLPIKYYWPISLMWSSWDKKIGGVLVEEIKTNSLKDNWYASGCGVRVNSKIPYSVSKIIEEHNLRNPNNQLEQLKLEPLIARTMNYMEEYLVLLEYNTQRFQELVVNNWMNSNQLVKIDIDARVKGITEQGFMILDDDRGFRGLLKPDVKRFFPGVIAA